MYIYMQFVQLRSNVNITNAGLKQFVRYLNFSPLKKDFKFRKCNLIDIIPVVHVDAKVSEINYYFTGEKRTNGNGLFLKYLQVDYLNLLIQVSHSTPF